MTTVEIPLLGGGVTLIDEADLPLVANYQWVNSEGYAVRSRRGRTEQKRLHKLLTGWPLTDHINGNGLDNRRANLRQASVAQNAANSVLRRDNSSGFKGVAWFKRDQCWHVTIRVNGKKTHIGYFRDPVAGALAYDAAARQQFGEFASLNFPGPGERGVRHARPIDIPPCDHRATDCPPIKETDMNDWLRLPVLARYTRIWTGRNTALERDRDGRLYITAGRDHGTRAAITETEARVLAAVLARETSKPAA